MPISKSLAGVLIFLSIFSLAGAQEIADSATFPCPKRDLPDAIRESLGKPPKIKIEGESSLLLVPVIGSNPATGFMFGIAGQYAFKLPGSLYSFFSGSAQVTTKNQYIFMLKNNVYTPANKLFLRGDWRFLIFSQDTYGLGTNSPENSVVAFQYSIMGLETAQDSAAQPMNFNFLRFHQAAGYKIKEGMYLGIGYMYDGYSSIVDHKLRLEPGDTLITSHFAYNTKYNHPLKSYFLSALNINFVMDTRDNMLNAYKGYYLSLGWRGGFKFIGSDRQSNLFQAEWRSFHPLSKINPVHMIAFWGMADLSVTGEFPYMVLPATAYDQRGRSARGYTQGRFRGGSLVYGEAEYRYPISKCGGIINGVAFVNATTANHTNANLALFESIRYGVGAGLRIMVDKSSRTNLAVDVGWGHQSFGFYLAASETF